MVNNINKYNLQNRIIIEKIKLLKNSGKFIKNVVDKKWVILYKKQNRKLEKLSFEKWTRNCGSDIWFCGFFQCDYGCVIFNVKLIFLWVRFSLPSNLHRLVVGRKFIFLPGWAKALHPSRVVADGIYPYPVEPSHG